MPLSTDLPTGKAPGDPNHDADHNATNTRVNEVATEVNAQATRLGTLENTATQVSVDGTPVATLDVSSTPVTAADVGALTGAAKSVRIWANASGQSLASGNVTKVTLAATEYNDDTSYYTISNSVITVRIPGKYLVSWSLKVQGGSAGERSSVIMSSGVPLREAQQQVAGSSAESTRGSDIVRVLAADTTIELDAWVSGGTAATVIGTGIHETALSLIYLGV